jgi:hypothetical protein
MTAIDAAPVGSQSKAAHPRSSGWPFPFNPGRDETWNQFSTLDWLTLVYDTGIRSLIHDSLWLFSFANNNMRQTFTLIPWPPIAHCLRTGTNFS